MRLKDNAEPGCLDFDFSGNGGDKAAGQPEIVSELIETLMDRVGRNPSKALILELCSEVPDPQVVGTLLRDPKINITYTTDQSLRTAASEVRTTLSRALGIGSTALHILAESRNRELLEAVLDRYIIDVDTILDHTGQTPLYSAAEHGSKETVKALLRAGANPDIQYRYGETALHYAGKHGPVDIIRTFLEARANPNIRDRNLRTALHFVSERRDDGVAEIVSLLIDYGATTDDQAWLGHTALHSAAWYKDDTIIKALLKAGANTNIQDRDKQTPLHKATICGNENAVKALLQAGANPNIKDNNGEKALDIARKRRFSEIEGLLKAREIEKTPASDSFVSMLLSKITCPRRRM